MTSPDRRAVVLVTGLSGAGKHSVLRVLEDLGHETVDNPPLAMLPEMVARGEGPLAIGVDARTRGFDAVTVLDTVAALRAMPNVRIALVYCWADDTVLIRRYAETRRRHPLAPEGRVTDGIRDEQLLTALLREHADLLIDTSNLPLHALRRVVEQHFGAAAEGTLPRMALTLVSFAYPAGLPRDADLVFDARFLRNPHYDPILQPRTGLDPEVGAYVEADPDFQAFFEVTCSLLDLVLPRFVQEGKKYVTIAIGCTGGRHRSVYLVERLYSYLARRLHDAAGSECWLMTVLHRELTRADRATEEAALPTVAPGNLSQEC
jgi:UPF0042 nucleotide-binding protein